MRLRWRMAGGCSTWPASTFWASQATLRSRCGHFCIFAWTLVVAAATKPFGRHRPSAGVSIDSACHKGAATTTAADKRIALAPWVWHELPLLDLMTGSVPEDD